MALLLLVLIGFAASTQASATVVPPNAVNSPTSTVGITVSWLPASAPAIATPGSTAQSTFWVTNQTATPIPVTVAPATAVPQNNGVLSLMAGADPRFSSITYDPSSFVAQPKATTPVLVSVTVPANLNPGYDLVPAIVQPHPPQGSGNINVVESLVALVTFQIPGVTKAHLQATFLSFPQSTGRGLAPVHHVPGLPPVKLATSSSVLLRVLDDSPVAFVAYSEITGTQQPFGSVVIKGHVPGLSNDVRGIPRLYFPGRYRDFTVTWHPSLLGLGHAHLIAYLHFQPRPTEVATTVATIDVLVVSPWWVLALAGYGAALLLIGRRKVKRQLSRATEPLRRRLPQVVASVVMIGVVVFGVFLAQLLLFGLLAGGGLGLALLLALRGRRHARAALAQRIRLFQALIGLVETVGVALTVLAAFSIWPGDWAVAVLDAAALWIVAMWWLLWWNATRTEPTEEHGRA